MPPATIEEVLAELEALNNRLQAVEHSHNRMKDAFVLSDLKVPDYDGHRVREREAIEREHLTRSYQRTATGAGIKWAVAGALSIWVAGLVVWVKDHLR